MLIKDYKASATSNGMNIYYVANIRLPTEKAHGLQIMKTCEAFGKLEARSSKPEERKMCVELIVPRRHNPIKTDPFEYYGVKKSFKITRLPCLDLVRFGKVGFFIEQFSFLLAAKAYLLFRKGIVYSREEITSFFFRTTVLELHTLPSLPGRFRKSLSRKARHIFVLTKLMQDELLGWGIEEEKISVLPDAVDFGEFDLSLSKEDARKKLALPLDASIALYAGSLSSYPWKGVDVLLEAAQKYQVSSINFQEQKLLFLLVGGSQKEIAEARKKYPEGHIMFVGHRPHVDIPQYLKAADVLVLPNKDGFAMSERHTSPLKLFEYMASGRPIVSSDLPSIREVLSEEEAVFFKPNSSESLLEALHFVLSHPEDADKKARRALEKAKRFTWSARGEQALAVMRL